ncbi:TetR/AcrR family transcriptional regulator [Solirubrobacter soli]|uniref:TetR/AcrR family transcriptional regulator n=1 Tax=Solirubrobacter soli TaxID=363832 RepID=UPI00041B71AF|nr:TetR/AcrR family transcriptional regulator [Solirubrobacter soli]
MPAPLRKDAARNRARLVDAAAAAFREDGLGASVNAIAQAAGVNVATLYRHFPNKEELVSAVLLQVLAPLADARDHALASDGSVLAAFLHEAVRLQGEHQGLIDALSRHPAGSDVREQLRGPAMELVAPVVDRAHERGELREDFDARDVLIALRMVGSLAGSPGIPAEDARRHVEVVVRGLGA